MVGRAHGDRIKVGGQYYSLPQHGFARRSHFETVEAEPERCLMRLTDTEETRAAFPFEFRLDVAYQLNDDKLDVVAMVFNEGQTLLPCGFGFHPAFCWPLPGASGAHEVTFERPETAPLHHPVDGLLSSEIFDNPFASGRLALEPNLFARGAFILTGIASRRATFGVAGGPSVTVAFADMPDFGLWTKPGAPFVCLEPWHGFAAPEGFDGEFAERPGIVHISPGASRSFAMEILIDAGP
jgi:galactose mutarotase-like enzyme